VCRLLNIQQVLKVLVLLCQESRTEIPFIHLKKREEDSLVPLLKRKKPEKLKKSIDPLV
jgi:hypothetical protein